MLYPAIGAGSMVAGTVFALAPAQILWQHGDRVLSVSKNLFPVI
jgi:hypothetical protein